MLENIENYKYYEELVKEKEQRIYTKDINDGNIDAHFMSILNIFKDGIETEDYVQEMFLTVVYTDGEEIRLHIFDYWFNIMMWKLWTSVGKPIDSEAIFFEDNITKKGIKNFCDNTFVKKYRESLPFIQLNNILERALRYYKEINNFAFYLADTVNMEDTIDLMNKIPEFAKLLKPDFSNVKFEDLKNEGLKIANEQIKYIKENDHCLAESFKAGEAINPKQFKEVNADIGTKPNGEGGVFPIHVNSSFINGGLYKPEYYYVESATGRQAQILSKTNVAISGEFARLLGTNNLDTWLHPDPDFKCNTKHLMRKYIKDATVLSEYNLRFYKENIYDTEDKVLDSDVDKHLIGKTLYFYSPTTCASFANGKGICRRCYGNLYFINKDINPGKLASDELSSKYTQTLLSAKHLLESAVIAMVWCNEFNDYFEAAFNTIILKDGVDFTGFKLKIDPDEIFLEDDETSDSEQYNEYISSCYLVTPDGTNINIRTTDNDDMFLSKDINEFIRKYTDAEDEDFIYIDLNKFREIYNDEGILFLMKIRNDELSKTLDRAKKIIDKAAITSSLDRESIVEEFVNVNNEGNICLNAVHYEVIIANQIRDKFDILCKPDWSQDIEPEYQILTLNQSLGNNPSITISLEYKRVSDTLYKPLTFRKDKASFLDLYFMKQPQEYINNPSIITEKSTYRNNEDNLIDPISFIDKTKPEVKILVDDKDVLGDEVAVD